MDKLSGQPLADFVLEELLVDPMVRLFMERDGVTENDLRRARKEQQVSSIGESE